MVAWDLQLEAPTATCAWRWASCLAGRVLLPITFAIRVRFDALRSERGRAGNSERGGNQRFGEFWDEISGCERHHQGSSRTPKSICRTGERRQGGGNAGR